MKATLYNYRQSPRKVRLVAGAIKGKSVPEALNQLTFLVKRGADPIRKLLSSAVANAKNNDGIEAENLVVKNVTVDKGMVMKRIEHKARGSANILEKKMSHITITLETKKEPVKKARAVKAKAKK